MLKFIKNRLSRIDEFYIGLIVAFLFTLYSIALEKEIINIPLHDIIELKILDNKLALKKEQKPGDEIVIIAIDQKTLSNFGKWPLERSVYAKAVDELNRLGALVVGFDVIFSAEIDKTIIQAMDKLEKDFEPGTGKKDIKRFKKAVEDVKESFIGDKKFAKSIDDFEYVILAFKLLEEGDISPEDIFKTGLKDTFGGRPISFAGNPKYLDLMKAAHYRQSMPEIMGATNYDGFINTWADWDGSHRRVPLVAEYGGFVYYSFSLIAAETYLVRKHNAKRAQYWSKYEFTKKIEDKSDFSLRISNLEIPVDDQGTLRINYYGSRGQFKYLSFFDLIKGKISKKDIEGKIVLIGATAPILHDVKPTPFDPNLPGVEIHATIIDNILHYNMLSERGYAVMIFEFLTFFLFGMILGLVLKIWPLWVGIPVSVGLIGGHIIFDLNILLPNGKVVSTLLPVAMLVTLYIILAVFKFAVSEASGREIKNRFKHYVADAVVEEMIERKDLNLGMVKKNLTVLFADIRNFASISEKMEPSVLEKTLNRHMTLLTDAILENGGTVDKYMGDAIMAIFGAPLDLPDHPYKACRAAFRMMELIRPFNKSLYDQGIPTLDIGVGISTGEVLVGNMGSEYLFNYSVLGTEVNVASRIEELNKKFGTSIIISENTLAQIGDRAVVRNLGQVQVKGIEREVQIFALSGIKGLNDTDSWSQPSIA